MKNHTMHKLWILILVAVSSALSAQVRLDKPEMYVGASVGVTESMVMFNPAILQDYLMGFNGGFVFRYIAEKNVGMQAELNFSQRGWVEKSGLYSRQLNYIELPFMTHIYVGKKNRVFLNFGPKISYLISEKVLTNKTGITPDLQQIIPIQHPFDYGGCAGLGLLFNIKGRIIQLDTRVNYSLSNIFDDQKKDYFTNSNNFNASLNLAWLFQVK